MARLLTLTPRCTSRNKLKVDWGRHSAFGVGVAFLLAAGLGVIRAPVRAQAPQNPESPEMKSDETEPTFTIQAKRNEVLVRVVVRDKNGEAVGNLTRDDFRLYDDGKLQALTLFSLEHGAVATDRGVSKPAAIPSQEPAPQPPPPPPIAQRFVAFYFDDVVMAFEDVVRTRDAAERYLKSSLQATDRAGIFTSSGVGNLEFTDDRDKLHEALARLKPRPIRLEDDCPPLTPYEAYQIDEKNDTIMLNIATWEVVACACGGDPNHCPDPQTRAQMAARVAWQNNQVQSRQCLHVLENLARRLGSLPGQRSILWLSQGFLALDLQSDLDQLIGRALRERVVISALDARGLWVDVPGGDASEGSVLPFHAPRSTTNNLTATNPSMLATLSMYRRTGKEMNDDVMAYVSHDTGGIFFHNNNDYDAGFRRGGGLPEFSYLLTFSPPEMKYNGKYHKLKVELMAHPNYSVQARRGYFAPNQAIEASQRADEEIEDAVFAQEEMRELRVDVQTQFFKVNEQIARLSVLARVDLESLRLRKENDRNLGDLKIVCAAFDRDGNLVAAKQRHLELRLRDATLARLLSTGLNIKTSLDLKAGTYFLRVVVDEAGSDRLSALNRTVEIPY